MSDRFRPARAGVINVWDYVDEEWAFADGRLALRGHNGSGKTKALEVLFPFVLDGVADSRRLDPFSGENRTMKSNLLYRGQESEYGYVWMEFARPAGDGGPAGSETVTLVIGMRAHRSTDGVRMSFYVTGRRLGREFGLLSADSRPLTDRQLRACLEPDAWRKTATEYRDLVDSRLFGLGRERYAQLLDLLLALRRPLLAKDLDPGKVSDTLSSGLSPVDEDLVQQAARDFENLAAVQKLFDDLTAANAATTDFLGHYEAYLRANVRFQLDRVQARAGTAADHAGRITAAAVERREAVAAERAAEVQRDKQRDEGEMLQGRLAGLKNSEEYKAQGRIEDKRREVAQRAAELDGQRRRLGRDGDRLTAARQVAGKLSRRAAEAKSAEARLATELADAAQRSGIADDGFGPVDPGDELLVTARARLAARRDDIGQIRALLEAIRDATSRRAYAEQDLGRKETAEEKQQQAAAAAEAQLAQARQTASSELAAWTARWTAPSPAGPGAASPDAASLGTARPGAASAGTVPLGAAPPSAASAGAVPPGTAPPEAALPGSAVLAEGHIVSPADADAEAVAEALERIGEPGATSLTEVFDRQTAQRQEEAVTARAHLDTQLREARKRLDGLRAERDEIAAEKDDAPPPSDLRPASRQGRPGAPFWQLVRFAGGVDDAQAAAVEGALYGAGLLTAWVHPDAALTGAALAAAEADGYLVATVPAAGGRSLADVLVPDDQDHVASEVVAGVLRSIALTDDVAVPLTTGAAAAAVSSPVVSTAAQFSYGVHRGARPKVAPEYIGATNRANRRRARLAQQDELIAEAAAEQQRLSGERERAAAVLEDLRRARRELPDILPVARAAEAVGRHAALLARARDDAQAARKALDSVIAEVDARTRQLRQAAAERRMPMDSGEVDAIARAAAEFENAATGLHTERAALAQAEEDLAAQAEVIERQQAEFAEAEEALAGQERLQQALEEEFRSLEETLQADVAHVLEQIRVAERQIRAAEQAYREFDGQARAEHDKATAADAVVRAERQALADAVGQLLEQAAAFGDYARPDLRPLLGVGGAAAWPDAARWPDPEQASDDLAEALVGAAGLAPDRGDVASPESGGQDPPVAGPASDRGEVPGLGSGGQDPAAGMAPPEPAAAVRRVLPPGVADILDAFAAATRGGRQVTEGTLKNVADRMSAALKDFTEALAVCDADYRIDWEPGAVVTVHVIDDEGRKPVASFATRVAERAADQGILLEDRERKVLEDDLLRQRGLSRDMNADTRSKPMSSGIAVGIRWAQSDKITDMQRTASRLLERDSPGPERLAELRSLLREMIREYRASHPRATYRETLASVLDYRSWHAFELLLISSGEPEVRLTRARHSAMSGGEKSAAIHLPLFAAANALYSSAKDHCPRMIALDEAFVGIDERYKPDLFGLAVKFDLDLFMTGHDLWVTTPTVPMIAHYDMYHDKTTRTVSALLILWDGEQLLDASAGYPDNDALAEQLLGFPPTRYAPLATRETLYAAGPAAAPEDDDEDDDGAGVAEYAGEASG